MAVSPMAGAVRIAPAMMPLRTSWATSVNTLASGDFDELESPVVHPIEAELAVGDVADVGEGAWPAGTRVLDVLALLQRRQTVDRGVDHHAVAVRDLAHVVADRCAGGLACLGNGQRDDADPVGRLRFVGIRRGNPQPLYGRGIGRRIHVG